MAKITIGRREHDLLFNVNAIAKINDKFGGLEAMQQKLYGGDAGEIMRTAVWMIALLINQATLSRNSDIEEGLEIGEKGREMSEEYIALKLTPSGIKQAVNAIIDTMNGDSAFDGGDDGEDQDVVLAEINAEKNA